MASTPRRTIDPVYLQDMSCPICGQDALQLKVMERYPDYVTCDSCESQFVLEDDGERVMYGKIPASYPLTRRFALQQWAWPEAIARRAADERPAATGGLGAQPGAPATPPTEPPTSSEAAQPTGAMPAAGSEFPPDPGQAEIAREGERPTWEDQDQDQELAELKALLDEAAEAPEGEAQEPEDLEASWAFDSTAAAEPEPAGHELETASEETLDDGPGMEAEGSGALEWEQAPPEWDEPSEAEEFDWSSELTESEELSQPDSEVGESSSFDYGLTESEPTAEMESPDQTVEGETGAMPSGSEPASQEWFFAEPEDTEETTDFEDDFAADVFGIEGPVDQEESAAGSADDLTAAPPFADEFSEAESSDLLPGETEPAPAMPDWLQPSDKPSDLEPEPTPGPEVSDQADDLLDSLWGEQEAAGEEEDEFGAGVAAGLGALTGAAAAKDEGPQATDEFDLWEAEEPAGGATDQAPAPTERPEQVGPFEPEEPAPLEQEPSADARELTPAEQEIAEVYWAGEVKGEARDSEAEIGAAEGPAHLEPQEPEPGIRYRVVMSSPDVVFPDDMCSHCNRSPAISKLPINATVFQGSGLGERQAKTYRVPLCANCTERAYARSEEQQTARLQAHLISLLVAMLLVVGALATRLVDFQESIGLDLAILLLLAGMGYVVPAAFLLIRASRFPQPEDSKFVETTLRVPADTEGSETAFEWRNPNYARHFVAANQEQAVSGAMRVHEREYEAT